MGRKMNIKKWKSRRDGQEFMSYEDWNLAPVPNHPSARMFTGRASMAGIAAPSGYMWCKSVEVNPPDGDDWVEVH